MAVTFSLPAIVSTCIHSPKDTILDIGCGNKHISNAYGKRATTIDAFPGAKPDILLDIGKNKLPFEDKSFDVVLFLDVIEHLTREEGLFALAEAKRVCKKRMLVCTPLFWSTNEENITHPEWPAYYKNEFNLHRSKWTPADFAEPDEWQYIVNDGEYFIAEWVPYTKPDGYSFLMNYHHRPDHFHNTLLSYQHHYGSRNDFEVLVCEDHKNVANKEYHETFIEIIKPFPFVKAFPMTEKDGISRMYNHLARESKFSMFMITNPEVMHVSNVLARMDNRCGRYPYHYWVISCFNGEFPGKLTEYSASIKNLTWFQHGRYNNRLLHFCSFISKDNYQKIKGFCEDFDWGVAYEDDDFRQKIRYADICLFPEDSVVTCHQSHEFVSKDKYADRTIHNRTLYSVREEERKTGKRLFCD